MYAGAYVLWLTACCSLIYGTNDYLHLLITYLYNNQNHVYSSPCAYFMDGIFIFVTGSSRSGKPMDYSYSLIARGSKLGNPGSYGNKVCPAGVQQSNIHAQPGKNTGYQGTISGNMVPSNQSGYLGNRAAPKSAVWSPKGLSSLHSFQCCSPSLLCIVSRHGRAVRF